jgi:hypothetical protein
MWFPVALLLLGQGEPKGTGFATLMVGTLTVIGAFVNATVFEDVFGAGLLFIHGLFYLTVGWSFYTGQTDLRPMGNVALTTALGSTIYTVVWAVGSDLIAQSWYLAIMAAIYAILTYEVFLNTRGRLGARPLAWSLIGLGVVVSLWIPAFWLLVAGEFPFGN